MRGMAATRSPAHRRGAENSREKQKQPRIPRIRTDYFIEVGADIALLPSQGLPLAGQQSDIR